MSSNPSKISGQFHEAKGSAKETLGNTFNASNMAQEGKFSHSVTHKPRMTFVVSGRAEHAAGEAEYNAARGKGYAQGTADRVTGKKDEVVGSLTNDRSQQHAGTFGTAFF